MNKEYSDSNYYEGTETVREYNNYTERIPAGIRELQMEGGIYLYGNGAYADKIMDILEKYSIAIEAVVVSKEYYTGTAFRNYTVICYEELLKRTSPLVVVAGFNLLVHKDLTNKLIEEKKIKKIYELCGFNKFVHNNYSFLHPKVCFIDNYNGVLTRNLTYDYFIDNKVLFEQTYEWLEDDQSKAVMETYLEGHIELTSFPMRKFWTCQCMENQYFSEDVVKLGSNETFVDCGAFKGDTLENFNKRVEGFKRYYAFEPDERCFDDLHRTMMSAKGEVIHVPFGAWDKRDTVSFSTGAAASACGMIVNSVGKERKTIAVDAIDNVIADDEAVSFLKMDIEGAELKALMGAGKTIARCKPLLAICVYHKREDLITIPQYIKRLVKEYHFYLRSYMPYVGEVVLYGVCER